MKSKDYNNQDYINNLVDTYKEINSTVLKKKLIDSFSPYFKKYVNMMCGKHAIDLDNADTIKFLRLFMSAAEREDKTEYTKSCHRLVHMFRKVFSDYTPRDLYDELVVYFLEALEKYKPMIADHKRSRERISFTHYLQVGMRFRIKLLIRIKSRDALSGEENLPYNEAIFRRSKLGLPDEEALDLRWVQGTTAGDIFEHLTKTERYILWLKYESDPEGKELSSFDISKITGLHQKSIVDRILKIKKKLKDLT